MSTNNSQSTTKAPTCKFCGKRLVRRSGMLFGKPAFAGFEACTCEGSVAARAAAEEKEKAQAKRDAEHHLCVKLEHAGVMKRFQHALDPRSKELAAQLLNGQNVFISGSVGAGKTHLACACARTLISQGKNVQFTRAVALFDQIKRSFNNDFDALALYRTCDVLVLDDLGKQSSTPWSLERLFDLVDERYARQLPTISTSNYTPRDLIVHLACSHDLTLSQSIVSRLLSNSVHITVACEDSRIKSI